MILWREQLSDMFLIRSRDPFPYLTSGIGISRWVPLMGQNVFPSEVSSCT